MSLPDLRLALCSDTIAFSPFTSARSVCSPAPNPGMPRLRRLDRGQSTGATLTIEALAFRAAEHIGRFAHANEI
jgi:hypothetical protein